MDLKACYDYGLEDWRAAVECFTGVANNALWSWFVLPFIIFLGVYFSFKTNFIQFRRFGHIMKLTTAKQVKGQEGVSPMQALLTAIGGRVGGGNLAGVGIALYMGGPGALFWMIVVALLMMAVTVGELCLGQMYKVRVNSGKQHDYLSGPPFFMKQGLRQTIIPVLFAMCFALQMCAWNGLQASYLDTYFRNILGTNTWFPAIGITNVSFNTVFLLLVLGTTIAGGAKWIIKYCEKVVPMMAGFYLCLAAWVILANFGELPGVVVAVVRAGFGLDQVIAGTAGWSFAAIITNGIRRGIYSNEAGVGSMSTLGGMSVVKHPAKQGLLDAFGVFLDTVVICTATGIMILTAFDDPTEMLKAITGHDLGGLLIREAFQRHFGAWSGYYLLFAFFTFSSTSVVANHLIGEMNLGYISSKLRLFYKVVGISIIGYGTVASVSGIVHIADSIMGVSVLMNVVAVFRLRGKAVFAIDDYEKQLKTLKHGDEPVFRPDKKDFDSPVWTS